MSADIIFFPGRGDRPPADHQAERRPSGIARYIGRMASVRPPEPRLSPEVSRERDVAQLREAIRRMGMLHGWSADDIWRAARDELV